MVLGEKLFEEVGKVTSTRIVSVHPVEGVKMEASFASEIKGIGNFPSGRNMGSGTMTQYPHGSTNAEYRGVVTTAEGEHFMWWANEKGRMTEQEGEKVKSIVIVSGVTSSPKLSWMNKLIVVIDNEFDPSVQQFRGIGYEWK